MLGEWILTLPFRRPPLSGNSRWVHWSVERRMQKEVKEATWALARNARIPPCTAITAELVWYPGRGGRFDPDNIAPTLKPALDGIVAAGVLPDDDSRRVLATIQRVVPRPNDPDDAGARLLLIIRDATPHEES